MRILGQSTWRVNGAEKARIQQTILTKGYYDVLGSNGTVRLTANTITIVQVGYNEYEVSKLNKPDYVGK